MYLSGSLCRLYFFLITALHLLLVSAFLFPDEQEHVSLPSHSPEQTEKRYKVSVAGNSMYAQPASVRGTQTGRKTDTAIADSVIMSPNTASYSGLSELHQENRNESGREEKESLDKKTEQKSVSSAESIPAVHMAESKDTPVKTEKHLNRSGIDNRPLTENRHKAENKPESEKKKRENVSTAVRSDENPQNHHPKSVHSSTVRSGTSSSVSASQHSSAASANVQSVGVSGENNQGSSGGVGKSDTPRDISSVEVVFRPKFEYPSQARRFGRQGLVVLILHVDSSGKVVRVDQEESSGHSDLDRSAMAYGADFRFSGITGGFKVRVPVLYRLK